MDVDGGTLELMEIRMLGTGSAFSKKYDNCNALVSAGGSRLLIDCGFTAPRALHAMKIAFEQLDGIFITHLHADHTGGLEEIAFVSKYVLKRKPRLFVPQALRDPLWHYSLRGGLESPEEGFVTLDDYFDVSVVPEREGGSELLPGLNVELAPTKHIAGKASYGVILNGLVYYSSDSRFDGEGLQRLYRDRGVRYILHDCQLESPGAVHTTLAELLTLPEELQRNLYLTHYGDRKDEFVGQTGWMTFLEQRRSYTFQP